MDHIYALHGFLGLPSDWEVCGLPTLAAIDLADQRFPSPSEGLWAWAEAFNAYVKQQPARKRILAGYSLGGRLALHALLLDPGLWDGALFLSTHSGLKDPAEKSSRLASDQAWAKRFLQDPWEEVLSAWNSQPVFRGSQHPIRAESSYDRAFLAEALTGWSLGKQEDLSDQIRSISTPYTWIVGEQDLKFLRAAPSEPLIVPKAGHRILFDNPDLVKNLIDASLR